MVYLREFLKNPKKTGALVASSGELAELITNTAKLPERKCIVEFGSGTGEFTKKILEKKKKDSLFFCLEINERFIKKTRKKIPDVLIYNDSAENIGAYLGKNGKNSCDCIISSLPWASFDLRTQIKLLDASYQSLEKQGGIFLTFCYLQGKFLSKGKKFSRQLYKKFSYVEKTKIVWNNFPPAFVYKCLK